MKIPPLYDGGIFILADMKNYILILICFLSLAGFAQEAKCGYYGKKTVAERNKIFPFNKTKRVVLIAYCNKQLVLPEDELADSLTVDEAKAINPEVIKKYVVQPEGSARPTVYFVTEEKEFGVSAKNELSNILCNYTVDRPGDKISFSGTLCRSPRNSVLFFDEENNVICCFQIDFECDRTALWPDPDWLDQYRRLRYAMAALKN
ncbi:hypothetical protein [Flavobacterium sp.]|uniref:hypothetical protein n=2 Tax=Flavobacterium sp. TaxID=239 RepID=UPI004034F297